jgi:hypothetical protein
VNSSPYPEGFFQWPIEQRNAYFAQVARDYDARKAGSVPLEPLPLAAPVSKARPYPIGSLGPVLGGPARSIAEKCQCAPALAGQSVLAVASLAAQRLADIRLPFGQTRPLSLFFVTVAGSGERKSTADNEALIPVRMHEKNLKHDYGPAHETGVFLTPHGLRSIRKLRPTEDLNGCLARRSFRLSAGRRLSLCGPYSRPRNRPLKLSRGIGHRFPALSGYSAPKAA